MIKVFRVFLFSSNSLVDSNISGYLCVPRVYELVPDYLVDDLRF